MTAHAVGQLLLALAVVIALARLLGAAAKRLGQPPVVGEIVAGVLLGPTIFGAELSGRLFPTEIRPALSGLANVGLVLFMFIIGYELDQSLVRGRLRAAAAVSLGSIVVPLGLGVGLAGWLAGRHDVDRVVPFALFLGAAMAVTAFPVLARILADRRMVRTELGGLALASAAVDDVVAWCLLAGVVAVGGAEAGFPWQVLLVAPYLLVMFGWVRPMLRRLTVVRARAGRLTPDVLGFILVGLLLSCYTTELLGLHAIFGAFVFGAIMPRVDGSALREEILERLEQVSVLLLLPVFFVIAGLQVDLSRIGLSGVVDLALILVTAIGGKFVGAYLGARSQRVARRPAGALAALMNTRGLTEIVILTVGLQLGILNPELFSLMVVMALVTTVMAGPLLNVIYPRRLVDRDIAQAQRAALGGPDTHRVLVVVPEGERAAELTALAVDLAGSRRPAEVVLNRLLPYPVAAVEVGAGLHTELAGMTAAMGELARLAESVRSAGLGAPVLVRYATDPRGELAGEVATAQPAVVLSTQPADVDVPDAVWVTAHRLPARPWPAVAVAADGADGPAALRMAAQLAAGAGVPLVVESVGSGGGARRANAAVRALVRQGVAVDTGGEAPTGALRIAGRDVASDGAHLTVQGGRSVDAAAGQWLVPPRSRDERDGCDTVPAPGADRA
ncbi:cation:proton antiporter [Micromonospora sp. NPDC005205]|uniref:cation:proton antiporter domain-containing protein n=1 Tax=Micromonospora sp. NPDC005205 TaxID=3156714 RepID=UPI0033B1571E